VADALCYFDGERCHTGDFVIMPNHVHWLVAPIQHRSLEGLLQSLKSHSAREINRICRESGRVWQKDSYDHIVGIARN
jgi:REP element-mobilizing transposase RayT